MKLPSPPIPISSGKPLADGLLARPRLFELLDRFRARPITWIEAPPGAGKTSLVSSWLQMREINALWQSVDARDPDPASFFHHLRQCTESVGALPALTPEYWFDLGGYARRFFVTLLERRADISVIVVDNFQETPQDSPLGMMLVEAAKVLAPAAGLIVLSREAPPVAFQTAIKYADVARVAADDLRFTLDETRSLAFPDSEADGRDLLRDSKREAESTSLLRLTSGWAAGLRLLLDGDLQRDAAGILETEAPSNPGIFDLLALEVFERSRPELRELWLATSWLTRFTASMAIEASDNADAGTLLDGLAARHYFIDRREGACLTFEYHPLFAQFLRAQARRSGSANAVGTAISKSASLLAAAGDDDGALALYFEAGDTEKAIPLILQRAGSLMAHGRTRRVCQVLASLSPALLDASPWLLYWLGVAQAATDPGLGRASVERAHRLFVRAGDRTGQAMCISAVLDSFWAEWNHLARFGPWLDSARQLVEQQLQFPSASAELRFWSSLLAGLSNVLPGDPLGERATRRVLELFEADAGANEKVVAASNLMQYLTVVGDLATCTTVCRSIEPWLDSADLLPLSRLSALHALGFVANARCDSIAGLRVMNEANRLVEAQGFGFAAYITRLFAVWMRLEGGRTEGAADELRALESALRHMRPNEVAMLHFLIAWSSMLERNPAEALTYAQRAVATIVGIETCGPSVCCHAIHSIALAQSGQFDAALAAALRSRPWIAACGGGALRMLSYLTESDALFGSGCIDEAHAALATALAAGRNSGTYCTGLFLPHWLARQCARALQAGIDPDYTGRLIAARGLESPSRDLEIWP